MLPALLGAAIGKAAPATAQLLRPVAELAATALLALACGSVVAHSAGDVLQAAPRLLGAVVLLHSGAGPLPPISIPYVPSMQLFDGTGVSPPNP